MGERRRFTRSAAMQYISLAEGLPEVSRLCCGTQQFSGTEASPDVTWGWMEQPVASEIVATAFDAGINFYDCAQAVRRS